MRIQTELMEDLAKNLQLLSKLLTKKQNKTILLLTRKLLYTWVIGSLEMSDI